MPRFPGLVLQKGQGSVQGPVLQNTTPPTAFAREHTGTRRGDQVQENARKFAAATASVPSSAPNTFRDVTFKANVPVTLNHGLEGPARFRMSNLDAHAHVKSVPGDRPELQIVLVADADCTADIEVYL